MMLSWIFATLSILHMGMAFQSIHYSSPRLGTTTTSSSTCSVSTTTTRLKAVSYDLCLDVGYSREVAKPLGVVFGENPDPYYGLVVDDVAEGYNGGKAGLRVGDQLMAVNGQVVVGKDFDTVMGLLQNSGDGKRLDLVLYRGPVRTLYTILGNRIGSDETVLEGSDDDEGEEPVIMDENYESPVRVEIKEEKPLTAGDVFKAMGKLGKMVFEDNSTPEAKMKAREEKKRKGFFGLGAEPIQLEGDDANTLK